MTSKPTLTSTLNSMRFAFVNGLSIEVRRMGENGVAEVWTRFGENGNSTIIDVSKFNILTPRDRNDYCVRLSKRTNLSFDWTAGLDWVVPMALNEKRKGEPIVELGTPGKEITKPGYDAYPFVVKGMPNLLFGDRGSLKSKLGLLLALIMMLPLDDNHLGITAPSKPLVVLKLDFEVTQDADEYEWRRLSRGLDIENAVQLKYRICRQTLADDVETISNLADSINADVLLIDSLGPAAGGDLNSSEPALRFNAAVRQLNRTTLITAHTAKNQTGKRSVYGNSFYENLARNIWEVTKEEEEDSDSSIQHIALKQTKSPPFAAHHKPMAFEFNFDDSQERTIVTKYDPLKMEAVLSKLNATTKVLNCLKSGPMSTKELEENTGELSSTVRSAVYRLKNRKKPAIIQLPGGDKYGLASYE